MSIVIEVDEILHTDEQPQCSDPLCPCHDVEWSDRDDAFTRFDLDAHNERILSEIYDGVEF